MRSPVAIEGSDAGRSSFSHRDRPRDPCIAKSSRRPGSTEENPSIVAASTGKNATTALAAIVVFTPYPNQITISGATATSGTIWKIVASG